jgi:glycerol-3-phosphate dehydrogenase
MVLCRSICVYTKVMSGPTASYDLLIVGGGINGAGIARDAAGRGLSVLLVEQDDLAGHTSAASTKLIHGGLRYLEHYAFRLVREALIEREKLLRIAPHIARPLTFVLPLARHTRPQWMIRLGLFVYDHLGGRKSLPGSHAIPLDADGYGAALAPTLRRGFSYVDGWVDDARLVILNALDARERGAHIRTRTRFNGAQPHDGLWRAELTARDGAAYAVDARAIINAGGPWVDDIRSGLSAGSTQRSSRLVKGSHIIVPRIHSRDHAYILQNADSRVLFAIPYERDFTLIGTTDVDWRGDPSQPHIDAAEIDYLCTAINGWLARPIGPADVVHSYSGIRALYDDGTANASQVTRDYVLALDESRGPPSLSIFGGKITTYRRLAEHALHKLRRHLSPIEGSWTADAALPGGNFTRFDVLLDDVINRWPFLAPDVAERLARAYGRRVIAILRDADSMEALGTNYGYGLTDAEIVYLMREEWAMTAEDILWRRSKLGLHLPPEAIAAIEHRMRETVRG